MDDEHGSVIELSSCDETLNYFQVMRIKSAWLEHIAYFHVEAKRYRSMARFDLAALTKRTAWPRIWVGDTEYNIPANKLEHGLEPLYTRESIGVLAEG